MRITNATKFLHFWPLALENLYSLCPNRRKPEMFHHFADSALCAVAYCSCVTEIGQFSNPGCADTWDMCHVLRLVE